MTSRVPPSQPHPPPPPRIAVPDARETGLTPEQEIRARALACAIRHLAANGELPSWMGDYNQAVTETVLELADDVYAAYIRDGSKP